MPPRDLLRAEILTETELPRATDLLEDGRKLAALHGFQANPFLAEQGASSEREVKHRWSAEGRIMRHAQIGFRDPAKTQRAWAEIYERCAAKGVAVDRYGICLDWSMGYPAAERGKRPRGTGIIFEEAEDLAKITAAAPVAPHFGDFVLGFPGAVENTALALAAGATTIGNLGQYFTFRLPGWDNDVATTRATVTALGLIAAQDTDILVHSNLDDGFAAHFSDLACCLGAVLIERQIVKGLIGVNTSHCYGHHFSNPVTRLAFQKALYDIGETDGSMIYGNTTSYLGSPAENYASLAGYLRIDIEGLKRWPTGHAINPVPVTENERIPDIAEVVDAQLFSARLEEIVEQARCLTTPEEAAEISAQLVTGARQFKDAVFKGLAAAGIDTGDAFELLLSLKRIGARRLEALFGPGQIEETAPRTPVIASPVIEELAENCGIILSGIDKVSAANLSRRRLRVLTATTDVHEHGKQLIDRLLRNLGVEVVDGGISVDPHQIAALALEEDCNAIALSTYNGVALSYARDLLKELKTQKLDLPVLIGGRLNQIPDQSNSSLPVDVTAKLSGLGLIVCEKADDVVGGLLEATDSNST
ncbi:cobalamin B12-binding domain-containing protein [Pelagibius sp. Alg239-R121]|uniref:cobalamin B12-binding domain-containing protein n=1 Tax=Pelagibius sp. Alg239-R121 TaxID=2993448 RepID=UPI0024A61E77|nr:cobalamin-dependent protein [Pelagibius sp. Alg239-R121]